MRDLLVYLHSINLNLSIGLNVKKIGNANLKWAFSEAAKFFVRCNEPAQKYIDRLVKKHTKDNVLSIIAHILGRAVFSLTENNFL